MPNQRGSYTASLLGNIRSHLAGLQGYDVMALELIQNADDAKAENIVFDITEEGLVVHNSGEFTYCGNLEENPCKFPKGDCDYHRITKVGDGGKLWKNKNIGRFGIGFLATYQVTDHPEIRSSGISLTLFPERGEWSIDEISDQSSGTTFVLPWAQDPNTEVRKQLKVSHIKESDIYQIADDLESVMRQSLLFLRHVRKAEVHWNGKLLLSCKLARSNDSDLSVGFHPGGDVENWRILRADASETAQRLYDAYPQLKELERGTEVAIGFRTEPEPLEDGFLYAFLPTKQLSGLPLHINADFFPKSDRTAVIFEGHKQEQAWNEMLIKTAAEEIAHDPEYLLSMIGHVQLWEILGKAFHLKLKSSKSDTPSCYNQFWEHVKTTAPKAHIVKTQDGIFRQPNEVFLPLNLLSSEQANVLLNVGGNLASEKLRPFWTVMRKLGAKILTLEHCVELLESTLFEQTGKEERVDENRLANFYEPLWSLLDRLLEESANPKSETIRRLQALPLAVTDNFYAVALENAYVVPEGMSAARTATLLPGLAIASHHFVKFPKLRRWVQPLNLFTVVSHLYSKPIKELIDTDRESLRDLYTLFADLDKGETVQWTTRSTSPCAIYLSGSQIVIW